MNTEQQTLNIQAGEYGVEVITDTAAHTGLFNVLVVLTAASATIVSEHLSGNAFTTLSLPANAVIRIPRMTSITLASGTALAYKSHNNPRP